MCNSKKGLLIEPWILKSIKKANTVIVRFENGFNTLEIEHNKGEKISYSYKSTYDYKGCWVIMYINNDHSSERAIFSGLKNNEIVDFYPRLNNNGHLTDCGLNKTELLMTVKRFNKLDVIINQRLFILDDEIMPPDSSAASITSGL